MKYHERIPLEQYAYAEVTTEGETFADFTKAVNEAKVFYANRIFKAPPSTPNKQAFVAQLEGNMCGKCGSVMTFKEGISKKNNKPWKGYFCPNSTKEDNHPPRFIK